MKKEATVYGQLIGMHYGKLLKMQQYVGWTFTVMRIDEKILRTKEFMTSRPKRVLIEVEKGKIISAEEF